MAFVAAAVQEQYGCATACEGALQALILPLPPTVHRIADEPETTTTGDDPGVVFSARMAAMSGTLIRHD